jgi:hypothetical protein
LGWVYLFGIWLGFNGFGCGEWGFSGLASQLELYRAGGVFILFFHFHHKKKRRGSG